MDGSEFSWRHLQVRWNPPKGSPAVVFEHANGDLTLAGMIVLRGFATNDQGCCVKYCDFVRDESLPLGTMVVEPKHA